MKKQTLGRLFQVMLASTLLAFISGNTQAKISEPDHIFYGNATYFNSVLTEGSKITVIASGQTEPLVEYSMGSDEALGDFYALRVPMDSVDPPRPGTVRPGEQVTLYIDGDAAAITQVGEYGKAVRLDIDPNVLAGGGPGISINDVSVNEGNSGESELTFTVSLNDWDNDAVTVEWATADIDATGAAACAVDVDYITASGKLTVPAGERSATLSVIVCGDTVSEADESFTVTLSNSQNGYIENGLGTGTILDDDTRPKLSIDDVQVVEPSSGSVNAVFTVSLSQIWNAAVNVDYMVVAQTAVEGSDFTAVSGTLTIDAGRPTGKIAVPVLADKDFGESNETFSVKLSNPVNGDLVTDKDTGIGTIIDPAHEPMLAIVENEIMAGSEPSAVVVSPDGTHVYVGGHIGDGSITVFDRQQMTGELSNPTKYDKTVTGFEGLLLKGITDLEISSDGRFLYAVADSDDAVNLLERNADTGALTWVAAYTDSTLLLSGAVSLALSSDGRHLYVVAKTANNLRVYARDESSGKLSFIEDKTHGMAAVDGMRNATSVAVSADGRHVYVTASLDNAIVIFGRNDDPGSGSFGQLNYIGLAKDDLNGVSGIVGASSVAVSQDGAYAYVAGQAVDALAQFAREPWGGDLAWIAQESYGDNGVAGLQGPLKIDVSLDGNYIYVLGYLSPDGKTSNSSLVVFQRNRDHASPDYGLLRVIQNMIDGEKSIDGLYSPIDMAISPDDRHLYIATNDSILVIQRLPQLIFGSGFD